jgi:hypothetical protein
MLAQVGNGGLAALLAGTAFFFVWLGKTSRVWKGQSVWVWILNAVALLFGIAAGVAIQRTWVGAGLLETFAASASWIALAFAVAAFAIPILALFMVIPTFPLVVNEIAVFMALLMWPMQAFLLGDGWIPRTGHAMAQVWVNIAGPIVGGAY